MSNAEEVKNLFENPRFDDILGMTYEDLMKPKNIDKISAMEVDEKIDKNYTIGYLDAKINEKDFEFVKDIDAVKEGIKRPKKKRKIKILKKLQMPQKKKGEKDSSKQKNLNVLMKEARSFPQKPASELLAKRDDMVLNENQKTFYAALMEMKVLGPKKVTLPPNICKDEVLISFVDEWPNYVTNDWLFLTYKGVNFLLSAIKKQEDKEKKENEKEDISAPDLYKLNSIKIISVPFKFDSNCVSFYAQDYNSHLYANEYLYLSETLKSEWLKAAAKDSYYRYLNIDKDSYFVIEVAFDKEKAKDLFSTNIIAITYKDPKTFKGDAPTQEEWGLLIDNFRLETNKAMIFYQDKNALTAGLKKFSALDDYFYYSQTLKPVKFCPASLMLPKETKLKALFTYNLDLNAYMNFCIKSKAVKLLPNMLNWDNLRSFMEFFKFFYFLAENSELMKDAEDVRKVLKSIVNRYDNAKDFFELWKIHYENFKRIVYVFLDAFSSKINLDKLDDLPSACDEYLLNDEMLRNDFRLKPVFLCLRIFKVGAVMMIRFLTPKSRDIVVAIKAVSERMKSTEAASKEALQLDIRSLGILVMSIFMNGSYAMIADIRSDAAFLGSVLGQNKAAELISHVLTLINNETSERKEKRKKELYAYASRGSTDIILDRLKLNLDAQKGDVRKSGKYILDVLKIDVAKKPKQQKIYGEFISKMLNDTNKLFSSGYSAEDIKKMKFDDKVVSDGIQRVYKDLKENVADQFEIAAKNVMKKNKVDFNTALDKVKDMLETTGNTYEPQVDVVADVGNEINEIDKYVQYYEQTLKDEEKLNGRQKKIVNTALDKISRRRAALREKKVREKVLGTVGFESEEQKINELADKMDEEDGNVPEKEYSEEESIEMKINEINEKKEDEKDEESEGESDEEDEAKETSDTKTKAGKGSSEQTVKLADKAREKKSESRKEKRKARNAFKKTTLVKFGEEKKQLSKEDVKNRRKVELKVGANGTIQDETSFVDKNPDATFYDVVYSFFGGSIPTELFISPQAGREKWSVYVQEAEQNPSDGIIEISGIGKIMPLSILVILIPSSVSINNMKYKGLVTTANAFSSMVTYYLTPKKIATAISSWEKAVEQNAKHVRRLDPKNQADFSFIEAFITLLNYPENVNDEDVFYLSNEIGMFDQTSRQVWNLYGIQFLGNPKNFLGHNATRFVQ